MCKYKPCMVYTLRMIFNVTPDYHNIQKCDSRGSPVRNACPRRWQLHTRCRISRSLHGLSSTVLLHPSPFHTVGLSHVCTAQNITRDLSQSGYSAEKYSGRRTSLNEMTKQPLPPVHSPRHFRHFGTPSKWMSNAPIS